MITIKDMARVIAAKPNVMTDPTNTNSTRCTEGATPRFYRMCRYDFTDVTHKLQ